MSKPALTIQDLASEAFRLFELRKRDSGEEFFCLKDGSPEWVSDMIMEAHDGGNVFPNDFIYEFVRDGLGILEDIDADEDPEDFDPHERLDSSVEHRTSRLFAWAASFEEYCQEAIEEGIADMDPKSFSLSKLFMCGQYKHREAVYHSLLEWLKTRVEELPEHGWREGDFAVWSDPDPDSLNPVILARIDSTDHPEVIMLDTVDGGQIECLAGELREPTSEELETLQKRFEEPARLEAEEEACFEVLKALEGVPAEDVIKPEFLEEEN